MLTLVLLSGRLNPQIGPQGTQLEQSKPSHMIVQRWPCFDSIIKDRQHWKLQLSCNKFDASTAPLDIPFSLSQKRKDTDQGAGR